MAKENSFSVEENGTILTEAKPEAVMSAKKRFIEPELSTPVDVLEATTFFQAATSGATN